MQIFDFRDWENKLLVKSTYISYSFFRINSGKYLNVSIEKEKVNISANEILTDSSYELRLV